MPGDWQYDNARLLIGDTLDRMAELPDGSVDLIAADLPYGTTACKWDTIIPFALLWEQYRRLLKPRGAVVLTASQPFTSALVMSNPGWFRHEWIWIKNRGSNFANTVREPMKEHESGLAFSPGKWTYNAQMQERTGSGSDRVKYAFTTETKTLNYGRIGAPNERQGQLRVPSSWQKFNTEVGFHPTQKPVPLFEYLIRTYSNPGDLVLDNTMGSGTTGVACVNAGRRFIGIERDPGHFATAVKRVGQAFADRPLFVVA